MRFDLIRPEDLSEGDAGTWRDLAALHADTRSPFLGPDWVRAVSACAGPDAARARVLVIRDGEDAVGFMGVRVGRFSSISAGAPFCDYQGLVLRPDVGVTARQVVDALNTDRLDLSCVVASDRTFADHLRVRDASMVIDLSEGYDAYQKERRAAGTDILQDAAKKMRKLFREHGEARFTPLSASQDDLATLIGWKRARYGETRQTDVLEPAWSQALMQTVFGQRDAQFGAPLFTLHAGDQLIAAHLALRAGPRLHAWIIAHDDRFARYSPGLLLIAEIIRWAASQGCDEFDLGPGDYGFKVRLANRHRAIGHGFVGRPSAPTWLRAAAYGVRETAEALPLGRFSELPGKAMRRLDLIRSL